MWLVFRWYLVLPTWIHKIYESSQAVFDLISTSMRLYTRCRHQIAFVLVIEYNLKGWLSIWLLKEPLFPCQRRSSNVQWNTKIWKHYIPVAGIDPTIMLTIYIGLFLDVIAFASSYPCQWVGPSLIVSGVMLSHLRALRACLPTPLSDKPWTNYWVPDESPIYSKRCEVCAVLAILAGR